jgi:hypothetical protein
MTTHKSEPLLLQHGVHVNFSMAKHAVKGLASHAAPNNLCFKAKMMQVHKRDND